MPTDPPLTKPAHLSRGARPPGPWLAQRKAALAAAILGGIAFIVVAIASGEVGSTPDARLTIPMFAATAIACAISVARREPGAYPLWLIGVGLAGAALVFGWFLLVAIIIGAAAVLILILHALM